MITMMEWELHVWYNQKLETARNMSVHNENLNTEYLFDNLLTMNQYHQQTEQ